MPEREIYQAIYEVREKMSRIETLLEQKFVNADNQIENLEERVKKLEDNQRWLALAVIGGVVLAVLERIGI